MEYGKRGHDGTVVLKLALATMHFGEENSKAGSFAIPDIVLRAGVALTGSKTRHDGASAR